MVKGLSFHRLKLACNPFRVRLSKHAGMASNASRFYAACLDDVLNPMQRNAALLGDDANG
jgi:hypothetical protein